MCYNILKGAEAFMSYQGRKKAGELIVSEEVIAKIAAVAAKDVPGVAGLAVRMPSLRAIVHDHSAKAVRVSSLDGAMTITIYLCLKAGVRIPDVCDAVQKSVKNSVQNMTGRPVAKVVIIVDDIDLSADDQTIGEGQE